METTANRGQKHLRFYCRKLICFCSEHAEVVEIFGADVELVGHHLLLLSVTDKSSSNAQLECVRTCFLATSGGNRMLRTALQARSCQTDLFALKRDQRPTKTSKAAERK